MTQVTGTGKYEQLLERCRSLGAIPTAVAHPCEASALAGPDGGGGQGFDRSHPGRARGEDRGGRPGRGHRPGNHPDHRCPAQPRRRGQGRGARPAGRGRAVDEGQPPHRRTPRRGRRPGDGPAHRAPAQPRLHHGRAHLSQGADRHRRRHQHRARASRTRSTSARTPSTWRSRWAWHGRRSRFSPRSRPSPRRCRPPSTPPCLCKMAERGQITGGILDGPLAFDNAISARGRAHQGHHVRGRRRSGHPAGAGSRGRQHPGEAAHLPRERRQRRSGAGRTGADHPDEPRRQRAGPDRQLRRRDARRPRQAAQAPGCP